MRGPHSRLHLGNQGKNQTIQKFGEHGRILPRPVVDPLQGQPALTVNRPDRSPEKVQTPEV